ncbi:MAG: hypothetical protein ACI9K5_000444 [Gammaproteobacteria bacterium]|jgi:hypothetical protein
MRPLPRLLVLICFPAAFSLPSCLNESSESREVEIVAGGVRELGNGQVPSEQENQGSTQPNTSMPAGPVDYGPRVQETWRVLKPGNGDTISLTRAEQGPLEVIGTIVQASTRTALICFEGRGPFRNSVVRDSILQVEPGTLALDRSYWAFRGYDMIDTLVERVEITGFGVVTPKHDEGHAIYLNLAGDFTVLDSHLHHNGGQALQLVNRPGESVLPPGPAAGTIRIENTRIAENGFNPDRGGFQVSIFGTGQAITMRNTEIVAGMDETVFHRNQTGGGLLIEAEADNGKRAIWWKPKDRPEDWVVPFAQGITHLDGVILRHRNPNKPLAQIKGCEELLVENCWFEGGDVVLDHPQKAGRNSGKITWRGNGGTARLFVRGKHVGPVSGTYEF